MALGSRSEDHGKQERGGPGRVHADTDAGGLSISRAAAILSGGQSGRVSPIWGLNWSDDATAMAAAYGRAEQFDGWLRSDEIANILRNYWRENVAV